MAEASQISSDSLPASATSTPGTGTITIDLSGCGCCSPSPPCGQCADECGEAGWFWDANEGQWLPDGLFECSCGTPVYPPFPGNSPDEHTTYCCTQNACIQSQCCPVIPATLYLSIWDCPGNALDGTTVPLVYGAFANPQDWTADYPGLTDPNCVSEEHKFRTIFGCLSFGVPEPIWIFETAPGYCGFGGGTIEEESCEPFFMSGTGFINMGFTAPTCSWSITA